MMLVSSNWNLHFLGLNFPKKFWRIPKNSNHWLVTSESLVNWGVSVEISIKAKFEISILTRKFWGRTSEIEEKVATHREQDLKPL